jgi:hypothetical protein
MAQDYIPGPDAAFNAFFNNLVDYVDQQTEGSAPRWTHIPLDALTSLRAAWNAAYTATLKPCTSPEREEKNRIRRDSTTGIRSFVNIYLRYHPAVSAYDKEQAGLRVRRADSGPVLRPQAQPEADIAYPGVHLIELIHIRAIAGTGDPRREYGVRIFWGILGSPAETDRFRLTAPPLRGEDLPHSTFTRRKRYRFDFSGESGKIVYFCLRYENGKGGKEGEGPFGLIFSAIIP